MTDFQFYSSLASKRTARYTGHKKCGAKSKKCTLPTDLMTTKQIERMNGPVFSYNLSAPMAWSDFKSMPDDIQKTYLNRLTQSYNVTIPRLAEMFGVCAPTVRKYLEANGIIEDISLDETGRLRRMSKQDLVSWSAFLSSDKTPHIKAPPQDNTQETDTPSANDPIRYTSHEDTDIKLPPAASVQSVSLRLSGVIDLAGLTNTLRFMLGGNPSGTLDITFTLDEKD